MKLPHGWDVSIQSKRLRNQYTRSRKGRTLKATEVWTDGRHAVDDKYVELDYELWVKCGQSRDVIPVWCHDLPSNVLHVSQSMLLLCQYLGF